MAGLNQDIITEVLLRLPVKSVFRFKLVRRDWLQYVMCPLFAQRYESHHGPSTLAGFLQTHSSHIHFYPVNKSKKYSYGAMITRPFRNLQSTHRIVASSDGRLLLVDCNNGWELLCNSITGELLEIPEFPHWAHGVGIIHQEPHVKLVFAYHTKRNRTTDRTLRWTKYIMFKTFTTETNQWTTFVTYLSNYDMCFDKEEDAGVVVRDSMYWLAKTGDVLRYKVSCAEEGDCNMICRPYCCCFHNANTLHCGSDGSLYYCSNDNRKKEAKIWVLSDDHNMSSWCMRYKVCLGDHGCNGYLGRALYLCIEQEVIFMWFYNTGTNFGQMTKFDLKDGKMDVVYTTRRRHLVTSIVPYFFPLWPAASFVRTESMI